MTEAETQPENEAETEAEAEAETSDIDIGREIVCVTGATGFIASHIIEQLLERGHAVRATVRSIDAQKVAHLKAMTERHPGTLEFARADLLEPGSFDDAVAGCAAVIHTAAVARMSAKDPQRDIVDPSVEGVNNVLSAVRKADSVRRFVHTSSAAAVYGAPKTGKVYDETDFNDAATLDTDPYGLAKTKAERSVWSFAEAVERVSAVSINPVLVLGEAYTEAHVRTSLGVFRDLLVGTFPAVPGFFFNIVDVLDVARAHVMALEDFDLDGRYIISHKSMWMQDLAKAIARVFPDYRIKTGRLPDFVMYIAALFDPRVSRATLKMLLGREAQVTSYRSQAVMGLEYTPFDETLRRTGECLIERGWARPKRR